MWKFMEDVGKRPKTMFQAVESELGDGVRVISLFFSTYPSLFVPALLAAADCSIIDYNLPRSIKANLMVMISPWFFFLVRSPRDFSDNLLNNWLGSNICLISGMPLSTVHLCLYQLLPPLDRFVRGKYFMSISLLQWFIRCKF